jgi:hypothetical protein
VLGYSYGAEVVHRDDLVTVIDMEAAHEHHSTTGTGLPRCCAGRRCARHRGQARLLRDMATALEAQSAAVLAANAEDMRRPQRKGVQGAMLDRLRLDEHAWLASPTRCAKSPNCLIRSAW